MVPTLIPGILHQDFDLPAQASLLEDLLVVEGGRLLQFPAGAAFLLRQTPIAHGPYPDPDPGHLCRPVAVVADTTAGRHRIGLDHGRGHRLRVDVGAVAAVADQATVRIGGEARVVEVTTAMAVAVEVGAVSGPEDNVAQGLSCDHGKQG